jgi:predicted transcriptional regulator
MPRPKKTDSRQPSELELQVLNVLWERSKGTVREVMEALPDGKQRAYTTVLSVMQLMEKKKMLSRSAQGGRHVYRPKLKRAKVGKTLLERIVHYAFGQSASRAIVQLMGNYRLEADEIQEIRALLDQHEEENLKRKGQLC